METNNKKGLEHCNYFKVATSKGLKWLFVHGALVPKFLKAIEPVEALQLKSAGPFGNGCALGSIMQYPKPVELRSIADFVRFARSHGLMFLLENKLPKPMIANACAKILVEQVHTV